MHAGVVRVAGLSSCRRRAFFFEKKKQKTFAYFGFGLSG
jgi:hypothetical protein